MLHEPQRDGEQVHCLALHPLVNKLHLKMLLARRHSRFDSYICPMVLSVVLLYRTSEELRRREKQLQTAYCTSDEEGAMTAAATMDNG